jgi:hypothetical protein
LDTVKQIGGKIMRTDVFSYLPRLDRYQTTKNEIKVKRPDQLKEFVKIINKELKEMENLIIASREEISKIGKGGNF